MLCYRRLTKKIKEKTEPPFVGGKGNISIEIKILQRENDYNFGIRVFPNYLSTSSKSLVYKKLIFVSFFFRSLKAVSLKKPHYFNI